ncbi:MAG TPA: iron-sulfur cluster assembly accessory protein [Bauldia sp.]|nr:iron-sulfur cluster assembly accessory protein [Bauldia sp.]
MASARPRPAVMQLTEAAANRVRYLIENAEKPLAGLRVGVKKGGCAGMEYSLEPVETVNPADDVISGHGVNVYIDPKAVLYLLGSVMDYETTTLRSGFVFQNPNEVSSCGCGESVMLKPAELPAA